MNLIILRKDDFLRGGLVRLYGRRAGHIKKVLRALPGTVLKCGVLNGNMGTGEITAVTGEYVELKPFLTEKPPAPLNIMLIAALPRPNTVKKVINSAVSFGVKRIYFTGSRKTDKNYWSSPVLEPDSIRKHVLMGLEQGKDTVMPDVQFRAFFKPFVEDELPEISRDTLKLLAHPADSPGPQIKNDTAITLAVGPEGGYTDYEAGLFKEKGFDIVSLGERVLRVEFAVTALIARLAFFKY